MARPKAPPKPLERDVQAGIESVLDLHEIPWIRSNAGTMATPTGGRIRLGPKGWPDMTGCLPASFGPHAGKMLAIEVKRPGGKLKPEQAETLRRLQGCGAIAFMADDVAVVDRILRGLKAFRQEPGEPLTYHYPMSFKMEVDADTDPALLRAALEAPRPADRRQSALILADYWEERGRRDDAGKLRLAVENGVSILNTVTGILKRRSDERKTGQ